MAARGWGGSIATAIGVAAGAGAAQLGLGYGLGIVAWQPSTGTTGDGAWVASLAWTAWIAATSAVIGAICADRLSVTPSFRSTVDRPVNPARIAAGLWRMALGLAAAVGALITVPLVAVPARAAFRANTFTPETTAATYAVVGVLIGLVIAVGALASRAVAANVIATASWLWLLAVVAVIDGVAGGRGLVSAQLGVWQFSADGPFRNVYLPGALLTLGAALVIGMLAPFPAARRGDNPVGVAISGAIGPLLVAVAYFLAAPSGLVQVAPRDVSAYWIAPYAVIAGLAGSVVIAVLAPRLLRRPASPGHPPAMPLPVPGRPTGPVRPAPLPLPAKPAEPLSEDAYAPSRAYASDSPGGGDSAGNDSGDSASTARGTASVKAPLWPAEATSGIAKESPTPAPASKGRSGRKNR